MSGDAKAKAAILTTLMIASEPSYANEIVITEDKNPFIYKNYGSLGKHKRSNADAFQNNKISKRRAANKSARKARKNIMRLNRTPKRGRT